VTARPKIEHPAPYSPEVLDMFDKIGPERKTRVHDPFAGTGERLGRLADNRGWIFTGTEIEEPFIVDPRVQLGDSTDPSTYPTERFKVMTSPVYPNGIADDFHAQDSSTRRTYRSAVAKILGHDRPLHVNNQGRYGYRGGQLNSDARMLYWWLAVQCIGCWETAPCDEVFLNVSDFTVGQNRIVPVVAGWAELLEAHGFSILKTYPVQTRRWRNGANRDARVANEVILQALRT
jgi:hypothetical protein